MPRNSQGLYTLPAGNPVSPNTLIESAWANTTMDDLAVAMTNSLPRNGAAPMTGPLTLSTDPITGARQAVSKEYVDNFLAYATGMPMGAITAYAANNVPSGWLLCDGQAVSRTTYADLYATIGTIYGAGDNTTTFNVPDLRNEFIRGLGGAGVLGTHYPDSLEAHSHGITGTHSHTVSFDSGLESQNHAHGITNLTTNSTGAHSHNVVSGGANSGNGAFADATPRNNVATTTDGAHSHTLSGTTDIQNLGHRHAVSGPTSASASGAGLTVGSTGGTETAPQHMVMNYIIKAVEDAPASGTVVTVTVGIVAPATAPAFVGAMYVDQTANKVYVATGTAASTDWSLLN